MQHEEVVRRVVKENPEILEAAANRRAVDQELRQARGLYLPRVDVEAAAGPELQPPKVEMSRK